MTLHGKPRLRRQVKVPLDDIDDDPPVAPVVKPLPATVPVVAPAPVVTTKPVAPTVAAAPVKTTVPPVTVTPSPDLSTSHPPTTIRPTTTSSVVRISSSSARSSAKTSSSSAAAASATKSAAASGGASTGAIVGIVAGGLLALAVLVGLILFFLRRWKKRGYGSKDNFNAAAFKRQSTALVDDHPHGMNYGGTHANPRPPSMIEHKLTSPPSRGVSLNPQGQPGQQQQQQQQQFGQQQQLYQDQPYGGQAQYEQAQYASYANYGSPAPGMGRALSPGPPSSRTPGGSSPSTPSTPGFFPNPYGLVPNSPLGSPISPRSGPFSDPQYNNNGNNNTNNNNGQGQLLMPPQPSAVRASVASYDGEDFVSHYVDLDRSSVTPFQAAQYAEINRRLNDNDPRDGAQQLGTIAETAPDGDRRSATIADFPAVPVAAHQAPQQLQRRSLAKQPIDNAGPFADLPPHSPSFARGQEGEHKRIPSRPPMLPEIARGSGYEFAKGSPRTNNFVIPSPRSGSFPANGIAAAPGLPPQAAKRRPGSGAYNDNDAYGGI